MRFYRRSPFYYKYKKYWFKIYPAKIADNLLGVEFIEKSDLPKGARQQQIPIQVEGLVRRQIKKVIASKETNDRPSRLEEIKKQQPFFVKCKKHYFQVIPANIEDPPYLLTLVPKPDSFVVWCNLGSKLLKRRIKKSASKIIAELQQKKEIERQRSCWQEWLKLNNYESNDLAIAHLIRYINKYIKTLNYKSQKDLIDIGYCYKDKWIESNKDKVIEHCLSKVNQYSYIDYQQMYLERDISGQYQCEEDFEIEVVDLYFAYKFLIEGVEFSFHSKKQLFEEDTVESSQTWGRTEPLESDRKIMIFDDAINAAKYYFREGI